MFNNGSQVSRGGRPLLVTGVPRSGTTWLARQLAGAPGCAMTGREPMNPKAGQYQLAGTVSTWTSIQTASPRQRSALRRAYSGLVPRTYGRYGHRQWFAPLPGTRIVVKDPFAVLSVRAIVGVTDAQPVLVYRHPAAVLSSYRRMGWKPSVETLAAALGAEQVRPLTGVEDEVSAMGWFWATLNEIALRDVCETPGGVVVSHEELAAGGVPALQKLFEVCGLGWNASTEQGLRPEQASSRPAASAEEDHRLHRLDRPSGDVARAWRDRADEAELVRLDDLTADVLQRLQSQRLVLN